MGVERITLAGHGALTRSDVHDWQLRRPVTFSQRVLLASPRGTYLAYADRSEVIIRSARSIHLRITGVWQRDVRFSLDEKHVAAVRINEPGRLGVSVYDLATGKHRVLAEVGSAEWIEWVRGGVVVSERHQDGMMLRYLPLEGSPRLLLQDQELAARFTTAKDGSRVLAFVGGQATLFDTTSSEALTLGDLDGEVTNAEMADDGSEAAFTTASGLHRWDGATLEALDDDPAIHTVWYWRGSHRLAYASPAGVTVRDGDRVSHRPSKRQEVSAMRFDALSGGVLVSEGRTLTLWRPGAGRSRTLSQARSDQQLRGADRFAGGVALWSYQRTQPHRPTAKPLANPFAEPPLQRQAVNAQASRN